MMQIEPAIIYAVFGGMASVVALLFKIVMASSKKCQREREKLSARLERQGEQLDEMCERLTRAEVLLQIAERCPAAACPFPRAPAAPPPPPSGWLGTSAQGA